MSKAAVPSSESSVVEVTFWSRAGESRRDPRLKEAQADPAMLQLEPEGRFYAGRLQVPRSGTLLLNLVSPRPLRIWLDGVLVLDEVLFWKSSQREVRAAVVCPVGEGETPLLVEFGPRPCWPKDMDVSCPARNREQVREGIRRTRPDRLVLSAAVQAVTGVPALSLRFSPCQFHRDGVTWQHVLARPSGGFRESPPSTAHFSALDQPEQAIVLATSVAPGSAIELTKNEERVRGLRRFAVPVANFMDRPEPLRAGGPERRGEPVVEVARQVRLAIQGEHGDVSLDMPGYESLGRQAPQREYRRIEWPALADSRPRLPEPVLPDEMAWAGRLYWAAWEMLRGLAELPDPESGLPNGYIKTTFGAFRYLQFIWDTSFTAMCTAYAWRVWPAYASLDVFYSRQFDGGYIHRELELRDGLPVSYEPGFSPNPPIMTQAEWAIARLTGNALRLAQVYPVLRGYHKWIEANHRLPDGTYWTHGLANGLDNSPSMGEGYPDLTAQMAHEAETLGKIARVLKRDAEAEEWEREYRAIGDALNAHLWSDSMRIYSTSQAGGGHNPNKVVTAFWPLWAGVTPPERVEALAQHLKDPKSFWRHHPVPSLAADSPHFRPAGDYWLGSTWAPTNFMTIKGFDRAGRHDLAKELALLHLRRMSEVYEATGKIWENYCSEASNPGSWSHTDYCWSALGPIAALMEVVIGLEPDALSNTLRWNPPDLSPVGVRNLPFGAATVSLVCTRDASGARGVDVESDRRFWLEVLDRGTWVKRECHAGKTRIGLSQETSS